jgi:hypothetical protein
MYILYILFAIIVVGVLLWIVNSYINMDSKIKSILNVVVVIALIIWLLNEFGVLNYLNHIRL